MSLYLFVASAEIKDLPCRWRIHTRYRLTVVNQLSDKLSQQREAEKWFDQNHPVYAFHEMLLLTKLNAKDGGFLVNDVVKIVAEIDVLVVICILDASKKSQEVVLNGDGAVSCHSHKEITSVKETVDVNGFQVLVPQAESVKRIFEKHPDMAIEFQAKSHHMRTSCITVLLNVIETLCQSLQDLSIDDMGQAKKALAYLKDSGFKVDWLERKLDEVKEKKILEQFDETRMQELEEELKVFKQNCLDKEAMLEKEKEELKDLKQKCSDKEALLEKEKEELKVLRQKCSDTEALLEKEKTKVVATTRAPPLTLDDVV